MVHEPPQAYESALTNGHERKHVLWWRRVREYAGIVSVAILFVLFGYAIYLGNRTDADEVELLRHVEALVSQQQELARRNQELIDFFVMEMARHRCQAEEGFDQILEGVYRSPQPDLVEELCHAAAAD